MIMTLRAILPYPWHPDSPTGRLEDPLGLTGNFDGTVNNQTGECECMPVPEIAQPKKRCNRNVIRRESAEISEPENLVENNTEASLKGVRP